ncbi:MAG: hypothetical protein M5U08_16720 [Burkholderiales bacterium]|nr:hypothetical protein [Burkholderiales bacterium]
MSAPTIASRLRRRCVLMTRDAALERALRDRLPPGWEMATTTAPASLGGFEEILQYRFLLLDLDEAGAFDPIDVLRELRVDLMLNVPVFCFGGGAAARDAARLARGDRFFDRAEIVERLPVFCEQYGWGGGR